MSAVLPLTLQTIQDHIHTNFANATDTPVVGSDDWSIRLNLINSAIGYWGTQKHVNWSELWVVGNTVPSTIAANVRSYAMPQDFNYMGDYVRLVMPTGKIPIRVYRSSKDQELINQSSVAAYVSGKPGSYILNLLWTPAANDAYVGAAIEFDYYKYPTKMSLPTDVPDMSDAFFIVHTVTAKLFKMSSPTNYNIHNNQAIDILEQMIEASNLAAFGSNNSGIKFAIGT